MVLPKKSWFVVADGAKASIFAREGRHGVLQAVKRLESPAARARSGDLSTDGPGRVGESANSAHHAYEPRTDPHRHEEDVFVKSVADFVSDHADGTAFDQLVIISPSRTLGQLRRDLAPRARNMVRSEIDKDFAHMTDDRVESFIAALDLP